MTAEADIIAFAQREIAAAQDTRSSAFGHFQILDMSVSVSEPSPLFWPWIAACLDVSDGTARSDVHIALKYDRAFLENHPHKTCFDGLTDMGLENILAKAGLFGRFCRDPLVWELYDPKAAVGVRLQLTDQPQMLWEETAPLANFIGWIARSKGYGMFHAGTIGIDDEGILLVGESGSGKSSTTLSAVLTGMFTVGDDYVLINSDGPEGPSATPTFATMKQDAEGLERCGLTDLNALGGSLNWKGKYVFPINNLHQGALAQHMIINAICIPSVAHQSKTKILKGNPVEAFNALMPSTLGQLSGDRRMRVKEASYLCRTLPVYAVQLGTDHAEVSETLRGLIQEHSI